MSYKFNPEEARDQLVKNIRELARIQGFDKIVVGISGGKDSTITAALCARAIGKDNVYGVMMPDGTQKDINDSIRVCQCLGIKHTTVNIGSIHKELLYKVSDCDGFMTGEKDLINKNSYASDINVAPRLRMTVLRYITQALGARLAGTGNLSEATVGYCTKDGDTSCDFSVLGGLTTVEVIQIGLTMKEIPESLVIKTPSDGLCGLSDEEKLGVSYEDIHHYIRGDMDIADEIREKIWNMEDNSRHKRCFPQVMYRLPVESVL